MGKRQHCKGIWHAKEIRFRSDSILIVVQIQVGSVRATAKVTEWTSFKNAAARKQVLSFRSVNKPKRKKRRFSLAPKAHYAPLQQMRVFGGTGEPRELVRCVGQRAYRCAVLDWKPMGLSFQMTTASSCCEGVARNRPPPDQVPVAVLTNLRCVIDILLASTRLNKNHACGTLCCPFLIHSGSISNMGQRIKRFDFVPRDPPQPPLSSKKEAALSTAESPLTLFIIMTRKGKDSESGADQVSSFKQQYRRRTKQSERPGAGKRVESIRLDDREKENEIRIWPKKKEGYGYHDRSPSRKKNLSKLLLVSGAFKHPKDAGVVNDISFLIENDDSFRKTKLFHFFFPKKYRSDGPTSHLLKSKRTLPAFSIISCHRRAEPFTMGGANAQGRSLDKRIRSRIAFFVESLTSEKKCLAEAKKRLTHFIRQANDLRFAGTTKTTISLFPFFGATFFFLRDGVGVYNNLFLKNAREQLLGQLRRKCFYLLGKDKVMELRDKFINLGGIGELIKGIEMMISIILRNIRIPYGYNSYLNEMKKMRSLLSNRTNTNTLITSVKIQSVYQSASLIAQDISFQLSNKRRSFSSIFSKIVKDLSLLMNKWVEGIRICCSGRLKGAEIAGTECGKYGKTSCNLFNQKIDYAPAEVSTPYGISGVKIIICYQWGILSHFQLKKNHNLNESHIHPSTCPSALRASPESGGFGDISDWLSCVSNKLFNSWHVESYA
uniref:Small ribosomal subunit protein uS3 C-terminal domain-containing protein n=1 Tax=Salix viminalis TaxID=40686 RepID=A0A6N2MV16_SALVM